MTVCQLNLTAQVKEIFSGHLKLGGTNPRGERISFTNYYVERNGKPWLPVMGEFHYSRFTRKYWEEELLKMKACGIDIVATYIFWNHHEEEQGVFDWSKDRDLREFIRLCGKHKLYAVIRIGPFCHGEARNGGFPDWLYGKPYPVRSNDERYLKDVERLYREIAAQIDGLLFKQGGPIIGVQLENEFMASGAPWDTTFCMGVEAVPAGSGGEEHMRILKRIALECGIDAPFFSCTAWDSPVVQDEFLPMLGGYAFFAWEDHVDEEQEPSDNYLFRDLHSFSCRNNYDSTRYPVACCEIGGGMLVYYLNRPVVPPESVEAMSVCKLGSGVNMIGYYMFHGGSNPVGKRSYLHEYRCPRISYDYQAPIREFGQLALSYRLLKRLFMFLHQFGEALAPMQTVLPDYANRILPGDNVTLRFAARTDGRSGFVFLNNYQDHVEMRDQEGIQIRLQLENETIVIPRGCSITLEKHASAILPFQMNLDGVLLKYATVQPLTRLFVNGELYYFFFAVRGIEPEFAFANDAFCELTCAESAGTVIQHSDMTIVRVFPGTGSLLTVTSVDGTKVQLVTLTQEQSLGFWKTDLFGRERIVLSEADLLFVEGRLQLHRTAQPALDFALFPAPDFPIFAEGVRLQPKQDGLFASYRIRMDEQSIAIQIVRLDASRVIVRFPEGVLSSVNDLFLRINYAGDVGSAYIDGQLVADHFHNGTVWEIGLKKFCSRLDGGEMVLHVSGRNENGGKAFTTSMAAFQFASGHEDPNNKRIHSVEAVVEYRILVGAAILAE